MPGLTFRKLNAAEFSSILPDLNEGFCPDPRCSIAIVAENNRDVVGRIFLVAPTHLEGPWIREPERTKTLGHSLSIMLVKAAEREAAAAGIRRLLAYGTPETESALHRLKFTKSSMTIWEKEL